MEVHQTWIQHSKHNHNCNEVFYVNVVLRRCIGASHLYMYVYIIHCVVSTITHMWRTTMSVSRHGSQKLKFLHSQRLTT